MDKVIRPEPIWTKNPKTGKEINVEPMFRLMNKEVFSFGNTPKELEERINSAIQYIITDTISNELEDHELKTEDFKKIMLKQSSEISALYELKDMFELMKER
jgi:predicted RNase H-like HicB family nuclease